MYPKNKLAVINPAARILESTKGTAGDPKDFPHVGTTYRLTEHFHYWTKHVQLNNIMQPEQFVEIGEALAKELGIETGQKVKVVVQAWLRQGSGSGDQAHQAHADRRQDHPPRGHPHPLGLCLDRGRKGYMANNLTASVGDGNSFTPEIQDLPREGREGVKE